MYCQHCGREIPNNAQFCGCCGAKQILLPQHKTPQPQYPNPNNIPNQMPPQQQYAKPNNMPNQVPPQPQYAKPNTMPNQVPPQPQYAKPNTMPNQVPSPPQYAKPNTMPNQVPPQPHTSVANSASAFIRSGTNKISSGISAGQIAGIPKATFIKIIAVITAVIFTIVVICSAVSNIDKKPAKEILGTWRVEGRWTDSGKQTSGELTFHSNGKYTAEEDGETYEGTYSVDSNDTLELTIDTGYEEVSVEFVYVTYENIDFVDSKTMWWCIEDDILYLTGEMTLFRV